jgi:hypothetical protein
MLGSLDRGRVTDLVYTCIINDTTGERIYMDGDSNPVTQEQVEA